MIVQVLTGDSLPTAKRLCREMGIDTQYCTTGEPLIPICFDKWQGFDQLSRVQNTALSGAPRAASQS